MKAFCDLLGHWTLKPCLLSRPAELFLLISVPLTSLPQPHQRGTPCLQASCMSGTPISMCFMLNNAPKTCSVLQKQLQTIPATPEMFLPPKVPHLCLFWSGQQVCGRPSQHLSFIAFSSITPSLPRSLPPPPTLPQFCSTLESYFKFAETFL